MTSGKEKRIDVRVSEAEREALKARARAAGVSVAEYIRQLAHLGGELPKRVVDMKLFQEIYTELRKQGGNLNQVARNLNQGLLPSEDVQHRIGVALEKNEKATAEIARLLVEARTGKVIINDSN